MTDNRGFIFTDIFSQWLQSSELMVVTILNKLSELGISNSRKEKVMQELQVHFENILLQKNFVPKYLNALLNRMPDRTWRLEDFSSIEAGVKDIFSQTDIDGIKIILGQMGDQDKEHEVFISLMVSMQSQAAQQLKLIRKEILRETVEQTDLQNLRLGREAIETCDLIIKQMLILNRLLIQKSADRKNIELLVKSMLLIFLRMADVILSIKELNETDFDNKLDNLSYERIVFMELSKNAISTDMRC